MSKTKIHVHNDFSKQVAHLRATICDLEACEFFLQRISHTVHQGYGTDEALNGAMDIISSRLYRLKDRAWGNIAMLSTISPELKAMITDRLKTIVEDASMSVDEFVGKSWNRPSTPPEEFKQMVKDELAKALHIQDPETDVVEVPKRRIEAEL